MNTATEATAPARGTTRAMFEVLRAPLLLSPIADVTAGAAAAYATWAATTRAGQPLVDAPGPAWVGRWACAALVGVLLLAAGMAQNAVTDLDDDRQRKRDRPLVRGELSVESVRRLWRLLVVAAIAIAWLLSDVAALLAVAVVLVASLYHHGARRSRVAGSALLGVCRALCLLLGAVVVGRYGDREAVDAALAAARDVEMLGGRVPVVALLYGLYVFGASLHASTDDEPEPSSWSLGGALIGVLAMGFLLCDLLLLLRIDAAPAVLGSVTVEAGTASPDAAFLAQAILAAGLLGIACWLGGILRALVAVQRLPPGAITGVLLSNLYLFDAAVCFHAAQAGLVTEPIAGGVLALVLFGASRLSMRTFPPT